jgi:glycosyltransferase involved in cell wall biosynthesis
MYNSKLNFLASMPNHITDEILQGKNLLPELKNVKNYILFFGRIEEYKGLDYLIQAYKNNEYLVENAKLVIAGCGKINNFECGIDQIIFINRYINNNEIRPLMENARVAVFPYTSSTQSSPPIIAACFGVPSIVTNIDGLREHVNDGKNGFVVPPRDIPGLQRSILAILQNDILYKSMIESQLLHYKNNHSIEKINRDYISIIEKVSI